MLGDGIGDGLIGGGEQADPPTGLLLRREKVEDGLVVGQQGCVEGDAPGGRRALEGRLALPQPAAEAVQRERFVPRAGENRFVERVGLHQRAVEVDREGGRSFGLHAVHLCRAGDRRGVSRGGVGHGRQNPARREVLSLLAP